MNDKILKQVDDLLRKNSLFETLKYISKSAKFNIPESNYEFLKAFWACRAIMAGGNDYRKTFNIKYIKKAFNYYFKFGDAFLEDNKLTNFFVRIYSEQLSYSLNYRMDYIARNIYIFENLAKNKFFEFVYKKQNYRINLHDEFLKKNKITVIDYFKLIWIILSYFNEYAFIDKSTFVKYVKTLNEHLKSKDMTECFANININLTGKVFNMLSCDYNTFRNLYNNANKNLDAKYIKSCFNPLNVYPVIETQHKDYVVPSLALFIKKAFNLFWYFENNIDNFDKNIFREKIFDKLFESYVYDCLTLVFNKSKIYKINNYKSNDDEFFDLIVEDKDITYLVEVKAYSLNIENYQTGDIEKQVLEKIIKKPLGQMYKRIKDLESGKYDKLDILKNKNVKPVCIYYDMPFVGTFVYQDSINNLLNDKRYKREIINSIGDETDFEKFLEFDYAILNITELEKFTSLAHKITLEDFIKKIRNNIDFEQLKKDLDEADNVLVNPLLTKQFDDFCNLIVPIDD